MEEVRISVRDLAAFVHQRGDLYPVLGGRVSPEEGLAAQKLAQRDRGPGYQAEQVVEGAFEHRGMRLLVSGRLDGCDLTLDPPLVEEIKTTRAPASEAERQLGSAHWAQVSLYAALLSLAHPEIREWQLRLLYCHPATGDRQMFERRTTQDDLARYLDGTLLLWSAWLDDERHHRLERNHWLQGRSWPYADFRPHQRALAGRVYRAFEGGERLLLEAPTGSGKTMGALYPAAKALAAEHVEQLFFLTSRTTGSRAALAACRDLAGESSHLRIVQIVAKEQACPVPGMPCDPRCPYSVGYHDRIRAAVRAVLSAGLADAECVSHLADTHRVCPFELSLDAALWADVIIGDYNYLLDPVVRLKRFAQHERLGVLVDESHQLAPRGRQMLSLELARHTVRTALKEAPPPLDRALRSLDRALADLRKEQVAKAVPEGSEQLIDLPAGVLRAIDRAMKQLAESELDLTALISLHSLVRELARWTRLESWLTTGDPPADAFRYLATVGPRAGGAGDIVLRLLCLDAGPYLATLLGSYGPHVRLSGTVTPLALHQALHGFPESPAERLASPFTPQQQMTLVVSDVPVYYRQRQRTLPQLADLVAAVVAARDGNYLVALPSFAYLDALAGALSDRHPALTPHRQTPGMTAAERSRFLEQFTRDSGRVGLIVLGGVFAESVDFSHAPLAGVICVGVGLPPVSTERQALAAYFDEQQGPGSGELIAYRLPAMSRVLQMAGRLLRSPRDRGVLCLVDDRFNHGDYARFFPHHWQPERIAAADVPARLAAFWEHTILPHGAADGAPRSDYSDNPSSTQ